MNNKKKKENLYWWIWKQRTGSIIEEVDHTILKYTGNNMQEWMYYAFYSDLCMNLYTAVWDLMFLQFYIHISSCRYLIYFFIVLWVLDWEVIFWLHHYLYHLFTLQKKHKENTFLAHKNCHSRSHNQLSRTKWWQTKKLPTNHCFLLLYDQVNYWII